MSAGVCIMNKNAVSLAADSAVTVGNHLVIHNSANKLFNLSRNHPVGIIIYDNSQFMGVPFSIIINSYACLEKEFTTLKEYAKDFIDFIVEKNDYFRFKKYEKTYVEFTIYQYINCIKKDFNKLCSEVSDINKTKKKECLKKAIDNFCGVIKQNKFIKSYKYAKYLRSKYDADIGKVIESFSLFNKGQSAYLKKIFIDLFDRDIFAINNVGIGICGYGKDEIYPSMIHIKLSCILNGEMRYKIVDNACIDENTNATITPFAQSDVIHTFLFGLSGGVIDNLNLIPNRLKNAIEEMDSINFAPNKKDDVSKCILKSGEKIINEVVKNARAKYLQPILRSVSGLPVKEMILLAESLINITSLRRKVAIDDYNGTVGGPIDVAYISKTEGFVWVKEKKIC